MKRFQYTSLVILSFATVCAVQAQTGRIGAAPPSHLHDISPQDNPAKLLPDPQVLVRNLQIIESRGLVQGEVAVQPWSDDYWPTYKGQLGYRYNESGFSANDFNSLLGLFEASHPRAIFESYDGWGGDNPLDRLSPSEKYDLLVGDLNFSLTKAQWAPGQRFMRTHGNIETWMGLCHGWAPAAYMLPRPTRAIQVETKVGNKLLTFYPADIKALATALWAESAPAGRFIGDRCNDKEVKRDSNGRIRDEACFNTNPGTLHSSLATKVGALKRSFVMDITYNYEVWNQPVRDYKFTYYNVNTGHTSKRFRDVVLRWKHYRGNDPFRSSRGAGMLRGKPEYIVGVKLEVTYMMETAPRAMATDDPKYDHKVTAKWDYDLELDKDFNITGGEWRSEEHTDFLWTFDPEQKAQASVERWGAVRNASFTGPTIPDAWMAPAQRASTSEASPLGVIVEELINRANR